MDLLQRLQAVVSQPHLIAPAAQQRLQNCAVADVIIDNQNLYFIAAHLPSVEHPPVTKA